jgi:hypothetical protein
VRYTEEELAPPAAALGAAYVLSQVAHFPLLGLVLPRTLEMVGTAVGLYTLKSVDNLAAWFQPLEPMKRSPGFKVCLQFQLVPLHRVRRRRRQPLRPRQHQREPDQGPARVRQAGWGRRQDAHQQVSVAFVSVRDGERKIY